MTLVLLPVLILLSILCCIDADIYVYKGTLFARVAVFHDILCNYGPGLPFMGFQGSITGAQPPDGCSPMAPARGNDTDDDEFVIISRGNCSYEAKVRNAQDANYSAVIVHNVWSNELVPMYYENSTGIRIPAVFVSEDDGLSLLAEADLPDTFVVLGERFVINSDFLIQFTFFILGIFLFMCGSKCVSWFRNRRRILRRRLPTSALRSIQREKYTEGMTYQRCTVCQEDFKLGDLLRILPCSHAFHVRCIDVWLTEYRRVCPNCKQRVWGPREDRERLGSDSDAEDEHDQQPATDRTPLLNQQRDEERHREAQERTSALLERFIARLRESRTQSPETQDPSPDDEDDGAGSTSGSCYYSINNTPGDTAPDDSAPSTSAGTSPDPARRGMMEFIHGIFGMFKPDTIGPEQNRRIEDLERGESQLQDSVTTTSSDGSQDLIDHPHDSHTHSTHDSHSHAIDTHHPEC